MIDIVKTTISSALRKSIMFRVSKISKEPGQAYTEKEVYDIIWSRLEQNAALLPQMTTFGILRIEIDRMIKESISKFNFKKTTDFLTTSSD